MTFRRRQPEEGSSELAHSYSPGDENKQPSDELPTQARTVYGIGDDYLIGGWLNIAETAAFIDLKCDFS